MPSTSLRDRLKARFVGLGFDTEAAQRAALKEKERADEMTAHIASRIQRPDEEAWARLTAGFEQWAAGWTRADEDKLQSEWQDDPNRLGHKSQPLNITKGLQARRVFTTTYWYVPEILLSHKHHLRADRTRGKASRQGSRRIHSRNCLNHDTKM